MKDIEILVKYYFLVFFLGLTPLISSCSGNAEPERTLLVGHVVTGTELPRAKVCLDISRDGRCGAEEPFGFTDPSGSYQLSVHRDEIFPLIAEVFDNKNTNAEVSYRLGTPNYNYSKQINPFTTLVHLSAIQDLNLAEDVVRDMLGLAPRTPISIISEDKAPSVNKYIASLVVEGLKAAERVLNWSSPEALIAFMRYLPANLTTLPTLEITTKDKAPILSKEIYVDATYVFSHKLSPIPTQKINGRIRGRGNATWGQPKNPYRIQFSNDASYAEIADVIGLQKNRNWVLLADYFDRSLLRNRLALTLANSSLFTRGLKWTPSGRHVEVTLNGDYVGVYLLTEDIRIDPSRLNINRMSSKADQNETDGGYIVEADGRLDCSNVEPLNLQFISPVLRTRFCIDTPDEKDITPKQLSYIKNFLREVEGDLINSPLQPKLYLESFADWYIISELFRNLDSPFLSSVFMWKDSDSALIGSDRLLNLGPLWDFDLSAGNIDYGRNWESSGCWVGKRHPEIYEGVNWMAILLNKKEFAELLVMRWREKRAGLAHFINYSISSNANRLQAAQARNFLRWPILGAPLLSHYTWSRWEEEVDFLSRFLNERMLWMDDFLQSPDSIAKACK